MKDTPPKEAIEEVEQAADGLTKVMSARETAIPPRIAERAKGVAVFAKVVEAAFILGGRGGDGVITARTESGWTAPAFFKLGGASVGLQLGGRETDLVLVFPSQRALDKLLDNRLEFGADISAVAGPVDAEGVAADATGMDDQVLVYTRDRGLFAGAALKGAIITPDNNLNRKTYEHTAEEILRGTDISPVPLFTKPFLDPVDKYFSRRS